MPLLDKITIDSLPSMTTRRFFKVKVSQASEIIVEEWLPCLLHLVTLPPSKKEGFIPKVLASKERILYLFL